MRFPGNISTSCDLSTNWKEALRRFVPSLRARLMLARSAALIEQANGLRSFAAQALDDAQSLRLRASYFAERAAQTAPWITEGE
jgi:hypothetical protein